jgi:predicted metal-binding protein
MATSLQGGEGGCLKCGYAENKRKQLTPEEKAVAFFKSRGFTPLVAYPGANRPWKSKCNQCGEVSAPHYNRVQSGTGCGVCAGKIVPSHIAVKRMKESNLDHLNHIQVAKRRGDVGVRDATERYLQSMPTFEMAMADVNTVEVTL